jgi:hypothetical protein
MVHMSFGYPILSLVGNYVNHSDFGSYIYDR